MRSLTLVLSTLSLTTLVSAHGYVDNATISGKTYTFYQPYQDPYTSPTPERISRPIQGNGPVTDVTLSDLQCGGYAAGGINGSSPAALHADANAGDQVQLFWTLWPESHVGPVITYMAKCPDTGCNNYMPGSAYVSLRPCCIFVSMLTKTTKVPCGSKSKKPAATALPIRGAILL